MSSEGREELAVESSEAEAGEPGAATATAAEAVTAAAAVVSAEDGSVSIPGAVESAEAEAKTETTVTEGEADDDEKDAVAKEDVKLELTVTNEFDKVVFADKRKHFLSMVSLKAPFFRNEDRAPIDLVAVVDESGSMAGERIALVRETVMFIIKNLESNDRFGIVGYESRVRDVLPLTKMSAENKEKALAAASTLSDRAGTALCAGLLRGVEMMKDRKGSEINEVASVMLFTDGDANEGPQTSTAIIQCVRDLLAGRKPAAMTSSSYESTYSTTPMLRSRADSRRRRLFTKRTVKVKPAAAIAGESTAGGEGSTLTGSETESGIPSEMSCVINTFGFGGGHRASLLQDIAEFGRGMYSYIAKAEEISDVFAECLGGLVSTVAQDITVSVQPMSESVEIKNILSKGYAMKRMSGEQSVQVSLKDIQSEEKRDLLFSLSLPVLPAPSKEYPILKVGVSYNNCVREIHETLEMVSMIERVSDDIDIGERNYELDLQFNRLLAAKAMEEADQLAETGDLSRARTRLKVATSQLRSSRSAKSLFTQNLLTDMETASEGLRDSREYKTVGSKVLRSSAQAHYQQRTTSSSSSVSMVAYSSRARSSMQTRFRSEY